MADMVQLNVVIDSREPSRVASLFERHDDVLLVEENQLNVGDIALGPGETQLGEIDGHGDGDVVAIERKSPADFVRSIQDRRLEDQIEQIYERFGAASSYVVVDGSVNDLVTERSGIAKAGISEYIGSLAARWQMVPLFAGYPQMEIDLITRVARKHFQDTNRVARSPDSTPKRKNDRYYLRMLTELDGIGREIASNIAGELEQPEDLIHADTEQLRKINGVGEKRAESIRMQIWGDK
jgi:ERCC4-type nuclease